MNFLRLVLSWLILAIIIAALLVAVAFVPTVQTRIARMALDRHPGLHGSLDSISAGFGKVAVENLHVEIDGAVLTVPSLEARLPLVTAARNGKVLVRSVTAKGWTLDLIRAGKSIAARSPAQATAAPGQEAAAVFSGILAGWKLPFDLSLDGADLEGDVIVPTARGNAPIHMHVAIKGGGMAAGHEGVFTVDATSSIVTPGLVENLIGTHGRLFVGMDSPRTFNRVEIKADLSVKGGSFPPGLVVSADAAANRSADGEAYTLDLGGGNRSFASIVARFPKATRQWTGTWKLDLRDSDLTPFSPNLSLPSIAAAGEGQFDADPAFTRVHAVGSLKGTATRLGVLSPVLDRFGPVNLDARFDLARNGQSIRVERLNAVLAEAQPSRTAEARDGGRRLGVALQLLQPFVFDEKTDDLKAADPNGDLLEGSIQGVPVAWLLGQMGGFTFAGDDAAAKFAVRFADGKLTLRTKGPLTAAGVSVTKAGKPLAQGLDLSAPVTADYSSQGWRVQMAPLTVVSAGRSLATADATVSRLAGDDQTTSIAGTWTADLEALASPPAFAGGHRIAGRSASGDISATLGASMEIEGKFSVAAHDPGRSASGSVSATVDADGGVSFQTPVRIVSGSGSSEFSIEGKWAGGQTGPQVDLRLTGENVAVGQLRLLAGSMAAAAGISVPAMPAFGTGGPAASARGRDPAPFWGNLTGRLVVAFDRFGFQGQDYEDVDGTIDVDHGSIRLQNARAALPRHNPVTAECALTFDPAAKLPYSLKASVSTDDIDAGSLFAAPQHGQDPVLEGRFSVARTLTGDGINLDDLAARTQIEYRFTSASTGGIIRLLKTSVAEEVPQAPTTVSDTLGTVGSAVGSLIGIRKGSGETGKNPVSKSTEAVLDFTYDVAEIGYDKLTATVIREPDQTIRLVDLEMVAQDEHLTGSGRIDYAKDVPLEGRPLSLELQLGLRGRAADYLSASGLLAAQKDSLGYRVLDQPLRFTGTMANIDRSQWHDMLAKLVEQKPKAAK